MNRREFLKLFGIGTAAIVTTGPKAVLDAAEKYKDYKAPVRARSSKFAMPHISGSMVSGYYDMCATVMLDVDDVSGIHDIHRGVVKPWNERR